MVQINSIAQSTYSRLLAAVKVTEHARHGPGDGVSAPPLAGAGTGLAHTADTLLGYGGPAVEGLNYLHSSN